MKPDRTSGTAALVGGLTGRRRLFGEDGFELLLQRRQRFKPSSGIEQTRGPIGRLGLRILQKRRVLSVHGTTPLGRAFENQVPRRPPWPLLHAPVGLKCG